MKYASPFTITTKILNAGTSTFSGDFCAQVFDTSNNLVGTIQTSSGNTITANDSSAVLNFATTGMYAMIPELYSIKVMYRSTGTTAWMPVAGNNTFINYTIMDVKNDTDIALYNNISVTTGLPVVSTHAVNVNVQVFNRGSGSFHGSFKADLINVATGTVYNVGLFTGQTLASGYYNTFNFNNGAIAAPAGTYALEIEHQYNGTGSFYTTSNLYYENAILVQVVAPSGIGNTTPPANEVLIYPNPSKDFMHILFNGVAVTGITVTDMQGREIQKLEVDGNQTSSVLPLGNYAAGMYLVQLQTATGAVTKKITVTK